MSHTPGPWTLIDNGSVIMTSAPFDVQFGDEGECVAECIHTKEDARLIAAAPEMLAKLEVLYRLLSDERFRFPKCASSVLLTINRAKGES